MQQKKESLFACLILSVYPAFFCSGNRAEGIGFVVLQPDELPTGIVNDISFQKEKICTIGMAGCNTVDNGIFSQLKLIWFRRHGSNVGLQQGACFHLGDLPPFNDVRVESDDMIIPSVITGQSAAFGNTVFNFRRTIKDSFAARVSDDVRLVEVNLSVVGMKAVIVANMWKLQVM